MGLCVGRGELAQQAFRWRARIAVRFTTKASHKHIGKSYRPTGPKLLAPGQIAAIIGGALGRKVKYQNAPMKLFLKVARSLGVADYVIEALYWYLRDYQRNAFGIGAPTDAVLEVGGEPAEDFEHIARRYVAATPFRKPTIATTVRAMGHLAKGLLTPAPNPEAIARRLSIPRLSHATLAADSAEWRASHSPLRQHG
jgi:NAD(P)H dehydrogenase (quinone)